MWQVTLESKIQLVSCELSTKFLLVIYCIRIHMCHRHIYLLLFTLIFIVFQGLIYFCLYVCTHFMLFCVPVNLLIRSVRFRWICDEIILWFVYESRIWFPTVTLSTLIIRVAWIEWWFLMALFLSLFLVSFFSWIWTSTVTAPWLRKFSFSEFLT